MKNKEKYIDEYIKSDLTICDFIQTYVLKSGDCIGYTCGRCSKEFKEWLEQEYIGPIKLTDDEIVILKNIDKGYKWISKDNGIYITTDKPYIDNNDRWEVYYGGCYCFNIFENLFKLIEPRKAYNIDDLLKQNGVER